MYRAKNSGSNLFRMAPYGDLQHLLDGQGSRNAAAIGDTD
jgi:hypothetical protein